MKNNGKEYELFVAKLLQAIIDSENYTDQRNIVVEVNKMIEDNCGLKRQFDIYWEYEVGGFIYKTVIECKDYESVIQIDKIDSFIGKTRDIPGLKLVFATKKGYQSGAITKAKQNQIELLVVREQIDADWEDKNGNPLCKKVIIEITAVMPVNITKFEPKINKEWAKEFTKLDLSKPIKLYGMNTEIFIEDNIMKERYSLYELASRLEPINRINCGEFSKNEIFEDAYIVTDELKLKLDEYLVEYSIREPYTETIEIDYSKELLGVLEYIGRGLKKVVFNDGQVKVHN